jgi:hypothetical protein
MWERPSWCAVALRRRQRREPLHFKRWMLSACPLTGRPRSSFGGWALGVERLLKLMSDLRHGEWSESGTRDIDHTTRGAREREREPIETIRPLADLTSDLCLLFSDLVHRLRARARAPTCAQRSGAAGEKE